MAEEKHGHCQCGAVSFTATVPGDEIDACHCGTCRRMNAGPTMVVPVQDLVYTGAAPATYASSEWATRSFCGTCGTTLAYQSNDGKFVGMAAFVFDPPLDLPLKTEVFIDEKPDVYAFAHVENHMTGAEVMAAFAGNE
ncbi:GFA family protein [Acuticoccus sp. I52.16.1]|uniref:GFA family protein n=1 Tax=Acuticoccus sp. I52.16.1 TaxID=2928472 RepID=UPI001FD3547D|nr:GFA family protein [Acuticoccus sp. I52.16.1]UOM34911.1 GFA family protein [Acuticoccus sp. I52.16.1]